MLTNTHHEELEEVNFMETLRSNAAIRVASFSSKVIFVSVYFIYSDLRWAIIRVNTVHMFLGL